MRFAHVLPHGGSPLTAAPSVAVGLKRVDFLRILARARLRQRRGRKRWILAKCSTTCHGHTRLQESECSERSSIRRRGVAGESPHLRGISRQNKTLHQRHAALPPSKKQNHKKTHVPQDPHLQKSHNQSLDGVIVLRQHLLDGFGDL